MIWRAVILALLFLSNAAGAAGGAVLAERAEALTAAAEALVAAQSTTAKSAALTDAIAQYEAAQAALRAELRATALRLEELSASQDADQDRSDSLVAALIRLGPATEDTGLLHPQGGLATARAGLVIAGLLPELRAALAAHQADAAELAALRHAQETALQTLSEGLSALQEARNAAIGAARSRRVKTPELQAVAEAAARDAGSLEDLANTLRMAPGTGAVAPPQATRLPVRGQILRAYEEPDAAGIRRPGWVVATDSQALVQAPFTATVLYAGPLKGRGLVVVLEPSPGHMLILTGLGALLSATGEVVTTGDGLGFTGSSPDGTDIIRTRFRDPAGTSRPDTLYIEARTRDGPVDPSGWFATHED
ncbi:MAG: hypothetical protein AAGF94_04075 [Pseudomonadota bacterium]